MVDLWVILVGSRRLWGTVDRIVAPADLWAELVRLRVGTMVGRLDAGDEIAVGAPRIAVGMVCHDDLLFSSIRASCRSAVEPAASTVARSQLGFSHFPRRRDHR